MAGYNKGFETKKIILDTCRKLFYEQGIRSTTYAGISEKCGVLPGSILYHYKNVMEIAGILIMRYPSSERAGYGCEYCRSFDSSVCIF